MFAAFPLQRKVPYPAEPMTQYSPELEVFIIIVKNLSRNPLKELHNKVQQYDKHNIAYLEIQE